MAFSTTPNCTVTTLATNKAVLDPEVDLSVYPNPTKGILNISFLQAEQEKVTIVLFDINGQKLVTITDKVYDAGKIDIAYNCNNLIKGVYLLNIQRGGEIVSKSFLKE